MYREKEIPNLGAVKFYYNLGAVGMFEDYVNESYVDRILLNPKRAKIGDIVKLLYFSYKVACKKLEIPVKFTMEDFEENTGTLLTELSSEMFADINIALGLNEKEAKEQKKMQVTK